MSEREKYPGHGNNSFNISLRQPSRYLEFLSILEPRHKSAVSEYLEYSAQIFGTDKNQQAIPDKVWSVFEGKVRTVQLETESFFIFSNIYLDKISHFIENYFGNERGLSLQSHTKLQKNFESYRLNKALDVPQTFFTDIDWLKANVGDPRDKLITHQKNPRTLHGVTGSGELLLHFFMPTEKDQYKYTPNISTIAKRLEIYTNRLISLVRRNRSKCRFSAYET